MIEVIFDSLDYEGYTLDPILAAKRNSYAKLKKINNYDSEIDADKSDKNGILYSFISLKDMFKKNFTNIYPLLLRIMKKSEKYDIYQFWILNNLAMKKKYGLNIIIKLNLH